MNNSKNEHEMNIHLKKGIKFNCSKCGHQFRRRYFLIEHDIFIHLLNGKSNCSICEQSFDTYRARRTHESVVHSIKNDIFKCLYCNNILHNKRDYVKHILHLHSEKIEQNTENNMKNKSTSLIEEKEYSFSSTEEEET